MTDSGLLLTRAPRPARRRRSRRRKLITRGGPILVLAAAAFYAGVHFANGPNRAVHKLVTTYVTDWTRGDVGGMYRMLNSSSRAHVTRRAFARRLHAAAATATATATEMRVVHVGRRRGNIVPVAMTVHTRVWGTLHEVLSLPVSGSGSAARVRLTDAMLFPGLRPGEHLHRHTRLPTRATLLASNGTPLAQGPGRTSPIPDVAGQIVGTLGSMSRPERAKYRARGYPDGTKVGIDGLEHIFQKRLVGHPGGALLAGRRVLATAKPVAAPAVKTTINPNLERAAVSALGGRYAGMAVMNPRTGALEALTGIAFSALQPPGSTMKIVTSTAALQAKLVTLSTTFPIQTAATIDGFTLQNAGGEACGGTLLNAFAVSCNSVFAPLGVRVGARRLVAMAKRYGFDEKPSIPGAATPQIPPANQIGDALAVGSSAIGQGKVESTPLEQADVAATIAMGGRRPVPTLAAGAKPRFVHVTTPKVAHEVEQMMIAVVRYGTGVPAAIPGVTVAGKTGTAELTDTGTGATGNANNPKNTDAWFVGYAPAGRPKVVAAALFPSAGAGAATAAPPVRDVIEAALR